MVRVGAEYKGRILINMRIFADSEISARPLKARAMQISSAPGGSERAVAKNQSYTRSWSSRFRMAGVELSAVRGFAKVNHFICARAAHRVMLILLSLSLFLCALDTLVLVLVSPTDH